MNHLIDVIEKKYCLEINKKNDRSGYINLSTNYLGHPDLKYTLEKFFTELNKGQIIDYPHFDEIRNKLKLFLKIYSDNKICLSPGSDSAIYYLMIIAKEIGLNEVIIQNHNYYAYENYSKMFGMQYKNISHEEICSTKPNGIIENTNPTFIFLVSPSCLTGQEISFSNLKKFISLANDNGHFIFLDQAYAFFGTELHVELLENFNNLSIIYTFSKAYGTAGMRLGCIISKLNIINRLREMGLENSVSSICIAYLEFIIRNHLQFKLFQYDLTSWRNSIQLEIKKLANERLSRNIHVFESKANFISIDFGEPSIVQNILSNCLKNYGIYMKPILNHKSLLRFSITDLNIMEKIILEIKKEIY